MAAALPVAKLAVLFLKVLTKPLSNSVKARAATNPVFRQNCITIGNGVNYISARLNVMAAGHTFKSVKPLDEAEAVKQGAEMASEFFVFMIFGSVATYEYMVAQEKSEKEKKKKNAKRLEKLVNMKLEHILLEEEVNELRGEVLTLTKEIIQLKSASTSKWYGEKDSLLRLQNTHTRLEEKIFEKKEQQEKELQSVKEDEVNKEKTELMLKEEEERKNKKKKDNDLAIKEGEGKKKEAEVKESPIKGIDILKKQVEKEAHNTLQEEAKKVEENKVKEKEEVKEKEVEKKEEKKDDKK